jgi:hypothetical protein
MRSTPSSAGCSIVHPRVDRDFTGLRRDVLAHLATATFVAKAENVILLSPPELGKTLAPVVAELAGR